MSTVIHRKGQRESKVGDARPTENESAANESPTGADDPFAGLGWARMPPCV